MTQALGISTKYEAEGGFTTKDLFAMHGVNAGQLFDNRMFAWLIGNCDAHAKNFSILEPGTPSARLAPMYYMLRTDCYEGLDKKLAMHIGATDRLDAINREDVEAMGAQIGFPPGQASHRLYEMSEQVRRAMETCEKQGVEQGPVNRSRIYERIDKACDWGRQ